MSPWTGVDRTLVVTTVKANGKGGKKNLVCDTTVKVNSIFASGMYKEKNQFMGFKVCIL